MAFFFSIFHASVETELQEPNAGPRVRSDGRCGPRNLVNGLPGECDGTSTTKACCSKEGVCGVDCCIDQDAAGNSCVNYKAIVNEEGEQALTSHS